MALLIPVVIAILTSLALTPLAQRLAVRVDAVSRPDGKRRLHRGPTPTWGGSAVCAALVVAVIASSGTTLWTDAVRPWLFPLLASGLLLCLVGCHDDCYRLGPYLKLLGQIVAVTPVVLAGCDVERLALCGFCIELGWLGPVFAVGWLVVGINALNLIDGIDGLASVIGIQICGAVALVAALGGAADVVPLALILAGAIVGFLVHNLPPARIFLGDSGSMLIGLVVSVLSLEAACATPRTANVTVLVALMFVPLLDTALAILRRCLKGRSIFAADRSHVHHRLLDRGFSVWGVLAFLGGLGLLAGSAACLAAYSGYEAWAWATGAAVLAVLAHWRFAGHEEWTLAHQLLHSGLLRWKAVWSANREPRPADNTSHSPLPLPHGHVIETGASASHPARQGDVVLYEERHAIRKAA